MQGKYRINIDKIDKRCIIGKNMVSIAETLKIAPDKNLVFLRNLPECPDEIEQAAQNYVSSGLPQLIRLSTCWPKNADLTVDTGYTALDKALISYTTKGEFKIPRERVQNASSFSRKPFFPESLGVNLSEEQKAILKHVEGNMDYISIDLAWNKKTEKKLATIKTEQEGIKLWIFLNGIIVFCGNGIETTQLEKKNDIRELFYKTVNNPRKEKKEELMQAEPDIAWKLVNKFRDFCD